MAGLSNCRFGILIIKGLLSEVQTHSNLCGKTPASMKRFFRKHFRLSSILKLEKRGLTVGELKVRENLFLWNKKPRKTRKNTPG